MLKNVLGCYYLDYWTFESVAKDFTNEDWGFAPNQAHSNEFWHVRGNSCEVYDPVGARFGFGGDNGCGYTFGDFNVMPMPINLAPKVTFVSYLTCKPLFTVELEKNAEGCYYLPYWKFEAEAQGLTNADWELTSNQALTLEYWFVNDACEIIDITGGRFGFGGTNGCAFNTLGNFKVKPMPVNLAPKVIFVSYVTCEPLFTVELEKNHEGCYYLPYWKFNVEAQDLTNADWELTSSQALSNEFWFVNDACAIIDITGGRFGFGGTNGCAFNTIGDFKVKPMPVTVSDPLSEKIKQAKLALGWFQVNQPEYYSVLGPGYQTNLGLAEGVRDNPSSTQVQKDNMISMLDSIIDFIISKGYLP